MKDEQGREWHRRVACWTKPSPPVVEAITTDVVDPDGRRDQMIARLSEFRECPGGLVARRVVYVDVAPGNPILVHEWRSEDLGDVPPSRDDFVVAVAPTTTVYGFKQKLPRGTPRRLDPSKIELSELIDYDAIEQEQISRAASRESGASGVRHSMTWISVGILVLIVLTVILWRLKSTA